MHKHTLSIKKFMRIFSGCVFFYVFLTKFNILPVDLFGRLGGFPLIVGILQYLPGLHQIKGRFLREITFNYMFIMNAFFDDFELFST